MPPRPLSPVRSSTHRAGRMGGWRRVGVWVALLWCVAPPVHAQAGHDIVLVIDVSTSMRLLFPELRERVYQEIDRAQVGDRVVLVTFGENAHLLARRRVRGPADRAYLRAIVHDLRPADRATYVTSGLDRSYTELAEFFRGAPERERRLLWLSDNKNNPPEFLGDDVLTLARLRERHDDVDREGEWFKFDAPLDQGLSSEVVEFMQWARRALFHIRVREGTIDLGTHPAAPVTVDTTVHFNPQVRVLAGLEFLAIARVAHTSAPGVPHRDLIVEPSTVVVRDAPWSETFTLTFDGPPGRYAGYLIFESFARENFLVEPDRLPLTFAIVDPLITRDEPELTDLVAQVEEEHTPAVRGVRGIAGAGRPLEFGPIAPGKRYTRTLRFSANAPLSPGQIAVHVEIALEEGWTLTHTLTGGDGKYQLRLQLDIDRTAQVPDALLGGGAVTGVVRVTADDSHITLTPARRELIVMLPVTARRERVATARPEASTSSGSAADTLTSVKRLVLPGAAGASRGATSGEATGEESAPFLASPAPLSAALAPRPAPRGTGLLRYILYAIAAGGLVAGAAFAFRRRPRPTDFFGEFIVVKDPGRRKLQNLNLEAIGARLGHQALAIGSAPRSDVRLRHDSVLAVHARLMTVESDGRLRVVLTPTRGAEVRINDIVHTDDYMLEDKDLLAFGDYLLLFSAPERKQRVIVQFVDGSRLHGTPVEWNIGEPGFQLLVDDAAGAGEVADVAFADVRAVGFVRHADRAVPEASPLGPLRADREITVEFLDGETLHGRVVQDYTEFAERFYVLPEDDGEMSAVLVERHNVQQVTLGSAPHDGPTHSGIGTASGR